MTSFIEKYNTIFSDTSRNVFILSILLFILEYLSPIRISFYINMNLLTFILIFTGFAWLFFTIQNNQEKYKKLEPYFKYGFLIFLLIITIGSLRFEFLNNIEIIKLIINTINNYTYIITLITIGFGFLTFYFNRERVEKEIEEEKDAEEKAEQKRAEEFDSKFPTLSKFNLNYQIIENWKQKQYLFFIISILISPLVFIIRLPYSIINWIYKEWEL
ncbi:MAG: hypothetical protein ACMXYG_04310 [Candidatus Woesearchaeota archaeon]